MADTAARASGAIGETASQATQAVTEQASEAVARSRRLSTATEKVVAGIEKHVGVIGEVEKTASGITAGLAALETAAKATLFSMEALDARTRHVNSAEEGVADVGRALRDAAAELVSHVKNFNGAAERFDTLVTARLDEVRRVPTEVAERAAEQIDRAVAAIRESLELLATAQSEAAANLVRDAGEGSAVIARHNEAMEAELARSRGNVAKVHAALVEMTDGLAARLEAHAG